MTKSSEEVAKWIARGLEEKYGGLGIEPFWWLRDEIAKALTLAVADAYENGYEDGRKGLDKKPNR